MEDNAARPSGQPALEGGRVQGQLLFWGGACKVAGRTNQGGRWRGGCKPGTPQETRAPEHQPPILSFIFSLKPWRRKGALLGKMGSGIHPEWAPH